MERYTLSNDINVFCVAAKPFPDGVLEAHKAIHSMATYNNERRYFGISRPNKGTIIYKAAAEETYQGEAKKLGCESFVIKSGQYISVIILNFMKDVQEIGKAFQN